MTTHKQRNKNRLRLKGEIRQLERRFKLKVAKTSDQPLTFTLRLIEDTTPPVPKA